MSRCKSCLAEITWARTEKGRRIPLDAEPVEGGNIQLQDGIAVIIGHGPTLLDDEGPRHLSHFVTCPNSQDWRKR